MTAAPKPDPEHFGALQELVDDLYEAAEDRARAAGESAVDLMLHPVEVRRLDVILAAEWADLPEDLLEVVRRLPPGDYTREKLCIQLNSIIGGHGWGLRYGTLT